MHTRIIATHGLHRNVSFNLYFKYYTYNYYNSSDIDGTNTA